MWLSNTKSKFTQWSVVDCGRWMHEHVCAALDMTIHILAEWTNYGIECLVIFQLPNVHESHVEWMHQWFYVSLCKRLCFLAARADDNHRKRCGAGDGIFITLIRTSASHHSIHTAKVREKFVRFSSSHWIAGANIISHVSYIDICGTTPHSTIVAWRRKNAAWKWKSQTIYIESIPRSFIQISQLV